VLRKSLLALLYITIPIIVALGTYRALHFYFLDPLNPEITETLLVDATEQRSFKEIARSLEEQGLIRSSRSLRLMARLQHKDTLVKAGEYEFSPAMSPQQILNKLVRGEMFTRKVTVKEGMTLADIGAALEQAGILARNTFDIAARDADLLREEGVEATSFEGYLFPETYQFPRNTTARKIIKTMHEQLVKRWSPEMTQRTQIYGYSKHQVITLASIIEKESGNFEEQPVISSVFHNRLKLGMRLQADPTVIYGIPNFNGNITKRDLTTLTPYNTYMIDGLPPGPIANPGLTAIKAALFPTDTDFLYFVGNGEGKHVFSSTLMQHNEAVNQFQRGRQSPPDTIEASGAAATAEPPSAIPSPSVAPEQPVATTPQQ
jgi:UPF0755 protein